MRDDLFDSESSENGDLEVLSFVVESLDFLTQLTNGEFEVVLGRSVFLQQGAESIVDSDQLEEVSYSQMYLVISSGDLGDVHVVGGGGKIFVLLSSEDVDSDQMDFSVTVLSSLGSGHIDDFAGESLHDDKAVLSQRRALRGVGFGGTRIGLEFVRHVFLDCRDEKKEGKEQVGGHLFDTRQR